MKALYLLLIDSDILLKVLDNIGVFISTKIYDSDLSFSSVTTLWYIKRLR